MSNHTEPELKVSSLELFFDLVFVYSITRVVGLIHHDFSLTGVFKGVLVLAMIYWGWSLFSWTLNSTGTGRLDVRLALFVVMAMSLLMARVIPDAYDEGGVYFVGAYFVFRMVANAVAISTQPPEYRKAQWTFIPLTVLGSVVALIGGFVDDPARAWIWLGSLVIDLIASRAAGQAEWRLKAGHFAERYGLLVIIALGESIVAIGAGISLVEVDLLLGVSLVTAVAATAVMWWSYFDWVAERVEDHLRSLTGMARSIFARDVYTFFHYPLVVGIVLFAVAVEEVVAHPLDPLDGLTRGLLAAGFALFLLSFVASAFRVLRRIPWPRFGTAAVVIVVSAVGWAIPALWLLAIHTLLILVMLNVERRRQKQRANDTVEV